MIHCAICVYYLIVFLFYFLSFVWHVIELNRFSKRSKYQFWFWFYLSHCFTHRIAKQFFFCFEDVVFSFIFFYFFTRYYPLLPLLMVRSINEGRQPDLHIRSNILNRLPFLVVIFYFFVIDSSLLLLYLLNQNNYYLLFLQVLVSLAKLRSTSAPPPVPPVQRPSLMFAQRVGSSKRLVASVPAVATETNWCAGYIIECSMLFLFILCFDMTISTLNTI